ncbi:hypothetical protein [Aquihabitans sp. McL0605]|uniref:hypothetical protein n=1 Tax=Aquihabitans sp. McL0605 TaxID=3415671 RepID=UPI003CE94F76
MRHARFDVAHLAIEQVPVILKAAYLLVAEQDGIDALQWECLAYALDPAPIPRGTYRVEIDTLDGRRLSGTAVLVRSVDGAHVLRGDGALDGVTADDLS